MVTDVTDSHRAPSRRRWAGPVIATALVVAGCAGDDDASDDSIAESSANSSPDSSTTSPPTTRSPTTTRAPTTTRPPTSTTDPVERCVELLERGCDGEGVERLQRLLRSRVDRTLSVDGDFGPVTERTLRSFEEFDCPQDVCEVDGRIVIDGPEWEALVDLDELPPAPEPSP